MAARPPTPIARSDGRKELLLKEAMEDRHQDSQRPGRSQLAVQRRGSSANNQQELLRHGPTVVDRTIIIKAVEATMEATTEATTPLRRVEVLRRGPEVAIVAAGAAEVAQHHGKSSNGKTAHEHGFTSCRPMSSFPMARVHYANPCALTFRQQPQQYQQQSYQSYGAPPGMGGYEAPPVRIYPYGSMELCLDAFTMVLGLDPTPTELCLEALRLKSPGRALTFFLAATATQRRIRLYSSTSSERHSGA